MEFQPWNFFDGLPNPDDYEPGPEKTLVEAVRRFVDDWKCVPVSKDHDGLILNLGILHLSSLEVARAATALTTEEEPEDVNVVYFAHKWLVQAVQQASGLIADGIAKRQLRNEARTGERREFYAGLVANLADRTTPAAHGVVAASQLFLWAVQNTLILHSKP